MTIGRRMNHKSLKFCAVALLMTACLASVSSCKKKEIAKIEFDKQEFADIASSGDKLELTVTTNYPWTATSSALWCTLSETAGEPGSTTLKLTIKNNLSPDARTAEITFTSDEATAVVKVNQRQYPMMAADNAVYKVDYTGGKVSINLSSNVEYDVSIISGSEWLREITTKGISQFVHTFEADANTLHDARTAELKFTSVEESLTVSVRQLGVPSFLNLVFIGNRLAVPMLLENPYSALDATVAWGDGITDRYDSTLVHFYMNPGEYPVKIMAQDAEGFKMNDIKGIQSIDLSNF